MSIREDFIANVNAVKRAQDQAKIDKCLAEFVQKLPALMQVRVEEAGRLLKASNTLDVTVYPDHGCLVKLEDLPASTAFQALHALCARPDVDVRIYTTRTAPTAQRGFLEGECLTFSVSLSSPYRESNYQPSPAASPAVATLKHQR